MRYIEAKLSVLSSKSVEIGPYGLPNNHPLQHPFDAAVYQR